jgi:sigma-B regulation protein RsbU (phosphoserine phosphatase)
VPNLSITKAATPRILYALLFLYAGIAGTYEVANSVATIIGDFNLRDQVQAPFYLYGNLITSAETAAAHAGVVKSDTVLAINTLPFSGQALWQRIRWYARPGDTITLLVRKENGTTLKATIPLQGYPKGWSVEDPPEPTTVPGAIFVLLMILVIPLFCLTLGVWVAFARPFDPNAWFILILLTLPQAFNPGPFRWWIPAWLPLRLFWHLFIDFLAPVALFLLGLLFPDRSRLDRLFPSLKWLVIALTGVIVTAGFVSEYNVWWDLSLLPRVDTIDRFVDPVVAWFAIICVGLYWLLLFDQLRATSSPDARRRLQVLLAGSVVGLGSILVVFGLLPYLGIADPDNNRWLLFLALVLMLFFPLTLAYVVIVQRAMDVRILLRIGSKYLLASTTVKVFRFAGIAALIWFVAVPLLTHHHDPLTTASWTAVLLLFGFLFFKRSSPTDLLQEWVDRRFFREAYNTDLVLNELSEQVRSFTETAPLIETVSRRISEVLHIPAVSVLLQAGNRFQLCHSTAVTQAPELSLAEESSSVRRVLEANRPVVIYQQNAETWLSQATPSERGTLQQIQAEVLLPLPGRERLMGIMALGPKRSEAAYSVSDLRVLQSLGNQTGLALEVSELAHSLAQEASQRARMNREMEIAREVQQRFFPRRMSEIQGLDLAGACLPALGVGGDYYDYLTVPNGTTGLAIGDIAGKGIAAALLMAVLQASLRGLTLAGVSDLSDLMAKLNTLIYDATPKNRFATFFYGVFDPENRRLRYSSAGHNAMLLYQKKGIRRSG